jgi:peptide/nickel transport system permease protein
VATILVYTIRRLLVSVVTLLLTATITFSLIHLVPGNPVEIILGLQATPTEIATLTRELHLNLPVWQQYLLWLKGLAGGQLGTSLIYNQPVVSLIAQALPRTLELSAVALVLALLVALPLGLFIGLRARSGVDQVVSAVATIGAVVPGFVWGLVFIYVFVLRLHVAQIEGIANTSGREWVNPLSYLLPAVALALGLAPSLVQVLRTEVIEIARADFVRTARSKGMSGLRVAVHDIFRNALLPMFTIVGTQFGLLLSGVVIIENIFSIPGMGNLLVTGVFNRDYPVILGSVLVLGAVIIVINLLVDLAYGLIDPRISYR